MTTADFRPKVIAMLMAALELPEEGDLKDWPLSELLGAPFDYSWNESRTVTISSDPVPVAEVEGIVTQSIEAFRDAYADHLAHVLGYVTFVFSQLAREAESACPDFDVRELLRRIALVAAEDDPEDQE